MRAAHRPEHKNVDEGGLKSRALFDCLLLLGIHPRLFRTKAVQLREGREQQCPESVSLHQIYGEPVRANVIFYAHSHRYRPGISALWKYDTGSSSGTSLFLI